MKKSSKKCLQEAPAELTRFDDFYCGTQRYPLDAVLSPRTVAVVGATEALGSVGRAVMENLACFRGGVFPINPKRPTVLNRTCYPSISDLPTAPDLAVIVTPARTVPGIIKECADRGVHGAVIISAGFKEVGSAGLELEQQVLQTARAAQMRVVGPNCLGVMSPHHCFNATFAAGMARPGKLAFISQSGALCTAILDWSFRENVGFSSFISIGSMIDVGWGDLIYHLGDDPHTQSIVIYMESIGEARSFMSAAREVAHRKPIIVIKVGRTEEAAQAAASHTGSLTGSDEVLDAAFRRVGVLRVHDLSELFQMADVLAKQPRPTGPRLGIITNAGGPAALSTDMLISSGGQLAELSPATKLALDQCLPPPWSHGNPIDILGDADAERYSKAVELVAADPNTDGLLVVLTPQKMTECTATANRLRQVAKLSRKPLLASWMGGKECAAGRALLTKAGIPVYPYPDAAARSFALMWRYSDDLRALYECPTLLDSPEQPAHPFHGSGETEHISRALSARPAAEKIILQAKEAARTLLTELESKQILQAYGIPTVPTLVARGETEAQEWAQQLGYPVVLKLFSETITHKTDVGGVQLNLANAEAVSHAWKRIECEVTAKAGREHFLGVTVQPMVRLEGYELILGSSIDSQFGPVLLFGAGGQLVEVMKDRALGLPPLTSTLARRMMEQTRILTALKGTRGRPPVDLMRLEQTLVRFSQLVAEQPWISEIDINPLLASAEGLVALDARVLLHDPAWALEQLPRPAIRAYPTQYITKSVLRDSSTVTIRPIRPEDEPLMVQFHQTLSERSVYQRYFAQVKLEHRILHDRLARLCFIDYDREMALVAVRKDPESGAREILGVGRLSKLCRFNRAELAIIMSDRWQGRGVGTRLLELLVQIGHDEKLECITAMILQDNQAMQKLCERAGFTLHKTVGQTECLAELLLRPEPCRAAGQPHLPRAA